MSSRYGRYRKSESKHNRTKANLRPRTDSKEQRTYDGGNTREGESECLDGMLRVEKPRQDIPRAETIQGRSNLDEGQDKIGNSEAEL